MAVLAGAGSLLVATAAVAATDEFHRMQVALPDGSVAHIEYVGDVAPTITVQPVAVDRIAFFDPFAGMAPAFADLDRVSALMERQSQAMLRQVAEMQRAGASGAMPGQVFATSNLPAGSYHYSYVSSTTSNGCTQTVAWQSDGKSAQPHMTRASSGDCGNVERGQAIVPVSAPQPEQAAQPRGKTI
jgi:hypothetical protein